MSAKKTITPVKPPSLQQIINCLRKQIEIQKDSHRHLIGPHRGEIVDKTALHTISCMFSAVQILRYFKQRGAK